MSCTSPADFGQVSRVKCITLVRRRKSFGAQPAGEPGRAAGGQHVRRPGHVVAQATGL